MSTNMHARPRQHAIKVQAAAQTAESLAAGDVVSRVVEMDTNFDLQFADFDPVMEFHGNVERIPGKTPGTLRTKKALVGGGAAATPPNADLYLKSAGHARFVVNSINLTGAPTGTFSPGERITDGGTKVGYYLRMLDSDTMLYMVYSGAAFAAADTLTGTLSGATGTVHGTPAITAMGFGYMPKTYGNSIFTTQGMRARNVSNGKSVNVKLRDAVSDGSIMIDGAGQVCFLENNFSGVADTPDNPDYLAATYTDPTPETWKGNATVINDDLVCVSKLRLNFGCEVSENDCSGAAGGIDGYGITDRNPEIQLDPLMAIESEIPFFGNLAAGTTFPFSTVVGTTATKRIGIVAGKCQYGKPHGFGERNGTATLDVALEPLIQFGDDEYIIYSY